MRYSWFLFYFVIETVVQGALQDKPPCPRKRGLSEELTWAHNRIQRRHLYKLNTKKASRGYIPEEKYKLRIHTTYLKRRFDDAQIFLEALDEVCGTGSFILDDPSLFSPKGCPDIVATRSKQPMGKAEIFWKAPKCGCVNIRVRVHSEGRYYLDDEDREVGPLSKRVCPKDKNLWRYPEALSEKASPQMNREHKLRRLCNATSMWNSSEVAKSESFVNRRTLSELTDFDQDRLETALQLRSAEIKYCCGMEQNLSHECFGDVRRRRIDTYCGTGEIDIPFTTHRKEWINKRKSECCWQIGEDRYHCFNFTLYQMSMLRDGRIDETEINKISLDEFDPANDLEDYPVVDYRADETSIKKEDKTLETTLLDSELNDGTKSTPVSHLKSHDEEYSNEENDDEEESNEDSGNTDVNDENSEDREEEEEEEEHKEENEDSNEDDDTSESQEIDTDRILTREECCHNGITAGTRVEEEGLMGCFRIAEMFQSIFTSWNTHCDRRFVVCCMRVVDAQLRVRHSKGHRPFRRIFATTLNNSERNHNILNNVSSLPDIKPALPNIYTFLEKLAENQTLSTNTLVSKESNMKVLAGVLASAIVTSAALLFALFYRLVQLCSVHFCS